MTSSTSSSPEAGSKRWSPDPKTMKPTFIDATGTSSPEQTAATSGG
jgi:hypothetical protein